LISDDMMKGARVQGGGSGRVLLVISAVAAIAIFVALSFFLMHGPAYPGDVHRDEPDGDGPAAGDVSEPKSTAEVIKEKAEECVNKNPTLTQEQCWDLKYHDMAIASYNQSLCEKIKEDRVREYCDRFFD